MFADSFEGPSIAQFWASGNYGSGPYTPGAVAMSREISRLGKSAVGITVRKGDIEQTDGPPRRLIGLAFVGTS